MNNDENLLFFDKDKLLEEHEEDFVEILMDAFWNGDSYQELLQLKSLVDANNFEEATPLLHKIKPSFHFIGMYNFYDAIEKIYRDIKENNNFDTRVDELKNCLNLFIENEAILKSEMIPS